jgi:D-beta-D-heptose 7-phosphate kinase/D-beta-D-heptose 1-phosphate adenosyltransferase
MKNMLSINRLIKTIERFNSVKILVLGDLMVDHYVFGETTRISPEAPVPVVDVISETFKLGGSANVANNILSLGGTVFPTGIVGADKNGSWLINEFKTHGGDVSGIIVDNNRPTTTKMRILVGHHQLLRVDYESREAVDSAYANQILNYIRNNIDDVDCIVISDYDKGLITKNIIEALVNLKQEKGTKIIVDPKIEHFLDYKGVSIIKTNINNARKVLKMKVKGETGIRRIASKLLAEFECDTVIITLGKDGLSLLKEDGQYVHIPALARAVYDITGAGDTVTAALALSTSTNASIVESALISNVAAAIKVGKVGTSIVTQDELVAKLHSLDLALLHL